MQARVEPQFLFSTLAQVQNLYEANAATGERMLDELIAYLRAATPRMRDTSSTLAQEIELARAYLAILKVRLGDRLEYAIDIAEDSHGARMPPDDAAADDQPRDRAWTGASEDQRQHSDHCRRFRRTTAARDHR